MNDGNSKKSKLSWSKKLIRKWFSIKSKNEEFQAHEVVYGGDDVEWRKSFLEREPSTIKKSKIGQYYDYFQSFKLVAGTPRILINHEILIKYMINDYVMWMSNINFVLFYDDIEEIVPIGFAEESANDIDHSFSRTRSHRRGCGYLDNPQIINIQKYSIFVSTWNVGGKSPASNMDLDNWIHSAPPVDIYVLGFQEIVPLNAGNILGAEDNGPAKKWLAIIKRTLNDAPGNIGGSGYYIPSPMPDPIVEWNADFEGSASGKASSFYHRRSFQTPHNRRMDNDILVNQPRLDRRLSVSDGVICGHRASDFDPTMRSVYRPSDSSSSWRLSDYSFVHCPSDYSPAPQPGNEYLSSRPSDYSWGQRPSDFCTWGLEEDFLVEDSHTNGWDACVVPEHSRYSLVASKQMVGIFLTIWIRSELREHVRNVKISCVGRGLMGYLGNKGSISISMLLHQTSLCFVCSHLTSGQKDGDELRRNADVMEILRKTRFPRVNKLEEKSPETVLEHDRIFWLGDLNYRVALPFRSAKALIEMQNWKALLDKDQLRIEQRGGRVFEGWKEGRIYFPPTYKYSHNSDNYAGDVTHLKEKRRTPAWCDRILWYGSGLQQLSYVRGESRFSDHRPVLSLFWAEIESVSNRFKKSMSSRPRIEVEELLPDSHGYTELSFF